MADKSLQRRSFSSWLSNAFDSFMGSIADRMAASLNATVSSYHRPGSIRNNANFFAAYQYDPQYFYDIMKNFPYFHSLVNVFASACYEVISKDTIKISCSDKKLEMQVNQALKDYKLKNFILDHLEEMLRRGSYTGIIGDNEITDIICPYTGEFISYKGKFLATGMGSAQLPFYDTFSYWYDQTIKNAFTVEEMKKIQPYISRNKADQQIVQLGQEITATEPTEENGCDVLEKFKESVELAVKIFKGKSYFEGYLIDIFRLYLKDYLYDTLSMTEYTKSQLITCTVPSNKADNSKSMEIINDIESRLNADNVNLMIGYSDPIQVLAQIQDKLINRFNVLPQLKDYSDLKELNLNKETDLLEYLTKDIENAKKSIEDTLKIPEAIFTGNGNRWEISSKYEAFTDILVHMLDTVSRSISRFCTSIVYRKTGQYYAPIEFQHSFDINKYISPYSKTSNIAALNDRISELSDLLESVQTITGNEAIDKKAFVSYLRNELNAADPSMEALINYVPVFMQDPETRSSLPDDFGKESKKDRGIERGGFEKSEGADAFETAFEEIEEPTPLNEEPGFDEMQDAVFENYFRPEEEIEEVMPEEI